MGDVADARRGFLDEVLKLIFESLYILQINFRDRIANGVSKVLAGVLFSGVVNKLFRVSSQKLPVRIAPLDLHQQDLRVVLGESPPVAIVDVLLLEGEEVPKAPSHNLQPTSQKWKKGALGDEEKHCWGYSEGPGTSEDQIEDNRCIVEGRTSIKEPVAK